MGQTKSVTTNPCFIRAKALCGAIVSRIYLELTNIQKSLLPAFLNSGKVREIPTADVIIVGTLFGRQKMVCYL